MSRIPIRLTEVLLRKGVRHLIAQDPDLAAIVAAYGYPPLWAREPGFPTLIHIILEQQVSLASARAANERLKQAGIVTPRRFVTYDDAQLKAIGFSRQKTAYGRALAEAILRGELDLRALEVMDDAHARAALIAQKGVGPWTADIYLLMALGRPDVWPPGDIALASAMQRVKRLPARPTNERTAEISANWRPWRAAAARLLWHFYLSQPTRA